MKIGNLYEQIAEIRGLKLGQKFNVVSDSGEVLGDVNPYRVTEEGIINVNGDYLPLWFIESMVNGSLNCVPLEELVLSDKEKNFLKSISELSGLPLHTVAAGKSPKGFQVLYVTCRKGKLDSFTKVYLFNNEFSQLDEFYEYTPKELGLED